MDKNFSEVVWREQQEDLLRDDEWTEYVNVRTIDGVEYKDSLWLWEPADLSNYTSNALKQNTVIRLDDETCSVEVFVMDPHEQNTVMDVRTIL